MKIPSPEAIDDGIPRIIGSNYLAPEYKPPSETVSEVDAKDKGTPDEWIKRHPELVRLTGRHPFNVEPHVDRLLKHGFITPASLHYVRNHGAVPRLDISTHHIEIKGKINKPQKISMELLRSGVFKEITMPVTLVCAGNRRKEENMVKQGLGFSWGSGAVSTSLWTGIWLKDLLEYVGIQSYEEGAKHVRMVGSDLLPNGFYGSSIRREVAMDPFADVLVAYKQNGEELTPDHGYPVRIIIPGYIGGRMIKWLKEIEVSENESDNHYHYLDNRVLPPNVDAERALAEGWWYKPQYIINELNINSSIVFPGHNDFIQVSGPKALKEYTISGYAYAGGGLPITRVEVSFDDGVNWQLSNLIQPEKPRHMGRYWCWSFWEYKVDVLRLLTCKEVICRAWQGQNTQPKDLTWNLLGMMNNCHFRCRIHSQRSDDGELGLQFEHPTQPGALLGGWMNPTLAPIPVTAPAIKKSADTKYFSKDEVAKHDADDDCWIIIDNKVYDVTEFLMDHPGGKESITLSGGQDATDEFNALHSAKARAMLPKYYIGDVQQDKVKVEDQVKKMEVAEKKLALNSKKKIQVKLVEREELTHNTRRFRFGLPEDDQRLGLPVGKHLFVSGKWKGEFVIRAYTPVTGDEVIGYVDLVVKVYRPCDRFPKGGKMSQLLDSLKVGEFIEMKGPLGEIEYKGQGNLVIRDKARFVKKIGMIAGGTGVTPMYQVAKNVLNDPNDKTELFLILANQSEDDILLKDELDTLEKKHKGRFHVHYTIDKVVGDYTSWAYSVGFVSEEMVRNHMPPFGEDSVAFMCGPPPMINYACIPNLEKLGYTSESYFSF
mmetsp:Transcript_14720/g.21912  ORF Transcript_14720/g.21912 Transcript_14720/m.21912 type:complete len:827 (+) Transcript_14720:61-2541(+)